MKSNPGSPQAQEAPRFINPHRLFHGVWLPQWLEDRPEVSEKAKKLYAYLTYFAGGKGYAWPSFNHLAGKLHISRRYVIKLVQELSAHGLIVATSVNVPTKGHCTNHYRFLWHPWMQTVEEGNFRMVVREEKPPFRAAGSRQSIAPPSEQEITSRTFAFFCGLKIFERFFSEAPDEKGEFGVCDNLPRRQHEVMAEKMRGCF